MSENVQLESSSASLKNESKTNNDAQKVVYQRPTESNVVTSPFGPRNTGIPGASKNHQGIDLRDRYKQPFYAAADGKVTRVGGSCNQIEIEHADGKMTRYLHATTTSVSKGKYVKRGDQLGTAGITGMQVSKTEYSHLHFEVRKDGTPIDPEAFLKSYGIDLSRKGSKGNNDHASMLADETKAVAADTESTSASSGNLLSSAQETAAIAYNKKVNPSIAKEIQSLVGVEADGIFGKITVNAIAAWQKANGLDADGKFGPASKQKAGFTTQAATTTQTQTTQTTQTAQNTNVSGGGNATTVSQAGLDLIKSHEGCKLTSYKCPAGIWTIGYGNTYYEDGSKVTSGQTITQNRAEQLLAMTVQSFATRVRALVTVDLTQNQLDALVSFSYNIGIGAFQSSTLLRKLNSGDYSGAANEFKRWNKGGGKVLQGLVTRRQHETNLFLGIA